jgi:hypothetical protein
MVFDSESNQRILKRLVVPDEDFVERSAADGTLQENVAVDNLTLPYAR